MRIRTLIAVAMLFLLIGGNTAIAGEYRLGPGDVLNISVWGIEDTLDNKQEGTMNEFIIRPDGKISFPLIGEVTAAGLATSEFADVVTSQLKEYIKDPKVTVNIVKFRTTRVYVLGEVTKPGMYELEKSHNVLDAIGVAGGYTKYAAKKSVFLLRGGRSEAPIKIDLLKLLKKGDMSQNFILNEGDVIYLNSNGKIDFARDILPFLTGGYYVTHMNND